MQSKRGIHTEADAPVYAQYIAALHEAAAATRDAQRDAATRASSLLERTVCLVQSLSNIHAPL